MRFTTQLSLLATLVATSVAQYTVYPSNTTSYFSSSLVSSVVITWSNTDTELAIYPFVSSEVSSLEGGGSLMDTSFIATTANFLEITTNDIVLVPCDASSYTGNIGINDILSQAVEDEAQAIILYSTTAAFCYLEGASSSYPAIFTMESTANTNTLLNAVNGGAATDVQIMQNPSATSTSSGASASSSSRSSDTAYGSNSPSTAVAMIILYSITGVITALFLIIIVTGAIRAHRHPERYGPQNILGRPRQSRAKGMAKAMLDTIPIVKFGERDPAKENDVELASTEHAEITEIGDKHNAPEDREKSAAEVVETGSVHSGIGPATADAKATETAPSPVQPDDIPGCSICTDDFETGQDLRVLPCDHKFHPACIDPWLLNVSGTCPLCRIDLRQPATDENAEPADDLDDLPPPITVDGSRPPRNSLRRSLFIGLLGVRPMAETTQQERLDAVRQWRRQQGQQPAEGTTEEPESRRRNRFNNLFGIRTRRNESIPE